MSNHVIEYDALVETDDISLDAKMSTPINLKDPSEATKYSALVGKPMIAGWELQSGNNSLSQIGVTTYVDTKVGNIEALLKTI